LASGLVGIGFAGFLIAQALQAGIGGFSVPGPGFILFLCSGVLGGLSLGLTIKSSLDKKGACRIIDLWKGLQWHQPLFAVIGLLLYVLVLPVLGYLATSLLLMGFLYALGRLRVHLVLVYAGATSLMSYVLFQVLLNVRFPQGIFGF
jgi:hypothetical protein